jgi:fission process protein 1
MSPRSICGNPFFQASNNNDKSNTAAMSDDKNRNNETIDFEDIPRERSDQPRPDFSKPLPRKRLPAALQDTLDNEEKLWETMYEGKAEESTESNVRYAAYATRIRTILMSAHRYVAYTSDIGESFRPVAHPYLVKGAYGISWAYLIGDVSHEGYKAYVRNQRVLKGEAPMEDISVTSSEKPAASIPGTVATTAPGTVATIAPGKIPLIEDYRTVMAQRAIFQGLASMGLPAFTIHSIVKYAGIALKNNKNVKLRTWGPIGVSTRSPALSDSHLLTYGDSWAWPLSLHFRSCSTSLSSTLSNGSSTRLSRLSVEMLLSTVVLRLADLLCSK